MDTILTRLPTIVKAALIMARSNGAIGPHTDTEPQFLEKLAGVLGAEGVYEADLQPIDAWLATLTPEQLEVAVDGDEHEMRILLRAAPPKTGGLLQAIFDDAVCNNG